MVRALMAFDAERLKVFEQLKVVRKVCADPESLNSQKRDAMQDLIEASGPAGTAAEAAHQGHAARHDRRRRGHRDVARGARSRRPS